jgi:iron complex transport system permease protein
MMGSFANPSWEKVGASGIMIIFGIIMLYRHSWSLNVLLLGEEQAQYMGIDVEWIKKYILLFTSLITGAAVSVSGIIGFVGLIIPHIMRIIVGPDHRILFPASTLAGACFLIFCDALSKSLIADMNLPVGIITALFGAPFFVYLLRKRGKTIYA